MKVRIPETKKEIDISWMLVALLIMLVLSTIYAMLSFEKVDKHEYGFTYNRFTGEIHILERDGWFFMPWPKYAVHKVDGRPYQIRITASIGIGDRVLNAKLVRFNPKGVERFVEWHGRSAGDNINTLQEIFKCYAFAPDGGKSCPFIEVMSETSPTTSVTHENGVAQTR